MMKKTVSIIIPVFNAKDLVVKCIDSILKQKYTALDVVIIDDGSDEETRLLCDSYIKIDSRVRVFHKKNEGVSIARNYGISQAKGDIITFCDADDYYDPGWIAALMQAYNESGADIVSGNYIKKRFDGQLIPLNRYSDSIINIRKETDHFDFICNRVFKNKEIWSVWSHLYVKEIIDENHIEFCEQSENFAEDLAFNLEYLLYVNKVHTISYAGYYYVDHQNSMMNKTLQVYKLNAMNENSFHLFNCLTDKSYLKKHYSIIHFLIMNNQYRRIVGSPSYPNMKIEVQKIENIQWYQKQTKALKHDIFLLAKKVGFCNAMKALILSSYCITGDWKELSICSAIYYKIYANGKSDDYSIII